MSNIEVKQTCTYCQGTGDYRGRHAENKSDFKSIKNKCFHCNGTGVETQIYNNLCKYCGSPCNGFCCRSCFREFEEEAV